MAPDELLARMSATLRHEIAPAVGDAFPKTQAFMAAVILEKLSSQLRLADAHGRADAEDTLALVPDVERLLGTGPPPRVAAALAALRASDGSDGGDALSALVAALYAERDALGAERFDATLARVRATLRARIDRQMAYAS